MVTHKTTRSPTRHIRRGNILLTTVILLPALVAIVSLAIDYGRVQLAKTELQNAADAAARHAAMGLSDGTAVAKAIDSANDNNADGSSVVLLTSDIETGSWDESTRVFTAAGSPTNAVRVTAKRLASRGNAVPLTFGRVIGQHTCDTQATAVAKAVTGGGGGIIGLDHVDLDGNTRTNSYKSADGAYSAGTARTKGYIASNGSISLNSSTVSLDAHMRSGQTLSSSSSSYGSRVTMSSSISVPTPSAGTYSTSNSNALISPSGALSGTNFNASGTVTIPAGNYYFTSFNASGATINITGATTIYLNGDADVDSSTINTLSNLPANLTIKVVKTSGPPLVKFNSMGSVYADIQAPTADLDFNSASNFYGRMIGKTVRANGNLYIHVDESLPQIPGMTGGAGTTTTAVLTVK